MKDLGKGSPTLTGNVEDVPKTVYVQDEGYPWSPARQGLHTEPGFSAPMVTFRCKSVEDDPSLAYRKGQRGEEATKEPSLVPEMGQRASKVTKKRLQGRQKELKGRPKKMRVATHIFLRPKLPTKGTPKRPKETPGEAKRAKRGDERYATMLRFWSQSGSFQKGHFF